MHSCSVSAERFLVSMMIGLTFLMKLTVKKCMRTKKLQEVGAITLSFPAAETLNSSPIKHLLTEVG